MNLDQQKLTNWGCSTCSCSQHVEQSAGIRCPKLLATCKQTTRVDVCKVMQTWYIRDPPRNEPANRQMNDAKKMKKIHLPLRLAPQHNTLGPKCNFPSWNESMVGVYLWWKAVILCNFLSLSELRSGKPNNIQTHPSLVDPGFFQCCGSLQKHSFAYGQVVKACSKKNIPT